MANVVKQAKYIKSDVVANNNKTWYAKVFDDNSVFVEWGRVGKAMQSQTKNFTSSYQAEAFFNKKCAEKEGDKKGYRKLDVIDNDSSTVIVKDNLADIAAKEIEVGCPIAKKLVKRLVDRNVHNITSNTTITYNVKSGLFQTPCGVISQTSIDSARDLLVKIDKFVGKKDFHNAKYIDVLNDYLTLVPQDLGMKLKPELIYPDSLAVSKQNDILDALEASLAQMSAAPTTTVTTDDGKPRPKTFDLKLSLVVDDAIIKAIRKEYKSTLDKGHSCAHLDVKTVYAVEIGEMKRAYEKAEKKYGNNRELWHGTKTANLLSIMKSGLKCSPPNTAQIAGKMFSNGIYFASSSSKSLNYSYGYWTGGKDDNCFMFRADVAMGRIQEPTNSWGDFPARGYDSVWAKAKKVGLRHDEFIVYSDNQCNLKYLIEFSPDGK